MSERELYETGRLYLGIIRRAGVLPEDSNFKTTAKRARVEPRSAELLTMGKLFWKMLSSENGRVSDIISLSYALKL